MLCVSARATGVRGSTVRWLQGKYRRAPVPGNLPGDATGLSLLCFEDAQSARQLRGELAGARVRGREGGRATASDATRLDTAMAPPFWVSDDRIDLA